MRMIMDIMMTEPENLTTSRDSAVGYCGNWKEKGAPMTSGPKRRRRRQRNVPRSRQTATTQLAPNVCSANVLLRPTKVEANPK